MYIYNTLYTFIFLWKQMLQNLPRICFLVSWTFLHDFVVKLIHSLQNYFEEMFPWYYMQYSDLWCIWYIQIPIQWCVLHDSVLGLKLSWIHYSRDREYSTKISNTRVIGVDYISDHNADGTKSCPLHTNNPVWCYSLQRWLMQDHHWR